VDVGCVLISFLFIDFDVFKVVNDVYGYVVGDEVLCAVVIVLWLVVRVYDMVVCLGGDEFVVLVVGVDVDVGRLLVDCVMCVIVVICIDFLVGLFLLWVFGSGWLVVIMCW